MAQTGLTSTTSGPPVLGEPQWTEEQHLAYLLANADILDEPADVLVSTGSSQLATTPGSLPSGRPTRPRRARS